MIQSPHPPIASANYYTGTTNQALIGFVGVYQWKQSLYVWNLDASFNRHVFPLSLSPQTDGSTSSSDCTLVLREGMTETRDQRRSPLRGPNYAAVNELKPTTPHFSPEFLRAKVVILFQAGHFKHGHLRKQGPDKNLLCPWETAAL